MKTLWIGALVLASVIVIAHGKTLWHQLENYSFEDYTKEFKKLYSSDAEARQRKTLFETRLAEIKRHNSDPTATWKMGVNHFTDRTEQERRQLLGYDKSLGFYYHATKPRSEIPPHIAAMQIPTSVDWRDKGIISAVKDQGQCGSCWTFGTSETIESYWMMETGEFTDLSEQQMLDCTPNPNHCGGTGGCQGGTAELIYEQLVKTGGLASEWTYPYISYFGENFKCKYGPNTPPMAKISGYKSLPPNKYDPVLQAVANVGPLVVNVDASSWFAYESGVYNGCNQTNPDIDHVVQLIGYGTDSALGDYWTIRNSWTPHWGEKGFMRIKRTSNVQCGTDITPSDGTGCKDGPPTVTVCGTCGILFDASYPVIAK